jgi:hypothetical protein
MAGPADSADRRQEVEALKDAFVRGRLAKEEFEQRIGQALAAYAELDALTADIPAAGIPAAGIPASIPYAGLPAPRPAARPEHARQDYNRRLIARGAAAGGSASAALGAGVLIWLKGDLIAGLVVGGVMGSLAAVLLTGLLSFLVFILDKAPCRHPTMAAGA